MEKRKLNWERRKILICVKTRPELSKTYREIVCTVGVFEDTKRLVRLYPIPLRFIDDAKVFKKYQWITASIAKSTSDTRPESYKISMDDIETHDTIPTKRGNWDNRARWVMDENNIFQSVEELKTAQIENHISLGIVKPKRILDIRSQTYSSEEKRTFWNKYRQAIEQMDLPLDATIQPVKPLTPPDYRFQIQFTCNDPTCTKPHWFSVMDWEIDALYFREKREHGQVVAVNKVIAKLEQMCATDKDTYFYLGNINSRRHIFTIIGVWWPKRKTQLSLFEV